MSKHCKGCAARSNGCIYTLANNGNCPCVNCLVKMVCINSEGCEEWSGPGKPEAFSKIDPDSL